MNFRHDWPYMVGAVVIGGGLGLLAASRPPIEPASGAGGTSPVPPSSPAAVPPPPSGRGRIAGDDPVVVHPGMTYFAALETNGVVNSAANVERIKARAETEGFFDVVVFKLGDKPTAWPVAALGDYVVRGTFGLAAPKSFDRHVGVTLGSVNLLDVVEA